VPKHYFYKINRGDDMAFSGWSGSSVGVSSLMLDYGSEGLASTEVVKSLYKSSLTIHKHQLVV